MKKALLPIIILGITACSKPVVETQTIPVFSSPSGAIVSVDGTKMGCTPMSVTLKKDKEHMITVAKEGYAATAVPIEKKLIHEKLAINSLMRISPFSTENPFVGPLDEIEENEQTGKAYQLLPKVVQVTLAKEKEEDTQ